MSFSICVNAIGCLPDSDAFQEGDYVQHIDDPEGCGEVVEVLGGKRYLVEVPGPMGIGKERMELREGELVAYAQPNEVRPYRRYQEALTLRMLGDNVTFTRSQWEQLYDEIREGSTLKDRIAELCGL